MFSEKILIVTGYVGYITRAVFNVGMAGKLLGGTLSRSRFVTL